ncbi:uncharacterized protein N7482_005068 [Penicillium canariense]|uniref:IgE-binding protein n=1 Tax=Penicillium canariense TaxID=189055 RepID=A0A9W9LM89_9EURO|nr:uncharacterized protein N7482_005068 [Penicillium canariense]KAJ5166287.1 hypothetical protein N7482_005068 [Penicillium canariense]
MKVSALLSLVPLAAALPGSRPTTKESGGAFGVTAARSGSPIHFLPLTASGSKFWLGGKSQTYCPAVVPNCAQTTNDTIIFGQSALDVVVPGGQRIYVDRAGALSFTTPHSGYIPPGSSQGPFKYTPGQSFGTWTYSGQGASGFMACPAPANSTAVGRHVRRQAPLRTDRWQVFAALQNATVPTGNVSDCLGFDALAIGLNISSDHLAWEYI